MPDLTGVAAELYAVAPPGFTAARTAAVREARQAKDRDLATAVGALRKPSAAAAAVNLLVRERPEDLGRLLDLGVRLREAQAALAGSDLRALHTEQQRTVAEVADAAVALLTDAGGSAGAAVRGQVEATLRAAMGDPDAAAAVATGLLTRDLFSSGFEPVDVEGAVAVPDAPALAGVPARRTPLRAVPEGAGEDAADADRPPARRRRGRLITAEEPEQPLRAAPEPGPARRRGRVVTTDAAAPAAGTPPAAPRSGRPTAKDRARAEREQRAEQDRAARERRAEQERADRERRREAARRSAEEDVRLAQEEAEARAAERESADRRLSTAESRAAELAAAVERTQEEIARLRDALADAEREAREVGLEVRHARSARTTAARAAERAASRLRDAETARDRL
ncbi:hypothetical protein [Cellulomonas sp. Marseille-Q8402]